MSALADTSVLIEHLRGNPAARDLLRTTLERDEPVYASVLTRIELSAGMRPAERRATDALVAALRWLPVDEPVARVADAMARRHGLGHSGIDAVDYCVAATAQVHELKLWTLNLRHFPMIRSLSAPW